MPPLYIFDPVHYAAVRRPLLQAETLPPWCYTSEAFYRREVERIFRRVWNFVGHVSQLAAPGDYFMLIFAGMPVILLRDQTGGLRAFANTCRHRGSALLEGSGNCRAIVCPYHSWTYGLDGGLRAAPEMQEDAWLRDRGDRADPAAPGYLGRLSLPLLRRHRPRPAALPRRSAGAYRALRAGRHGLHPPQGIHDRVQLEAVRRERQGIPTTSPPCTGTRSIATPRRAAPATGSRTPRANMCAPSRRTMAAWRC